MPKKKTKKLYSPDDKLKELLEHSEFLRPDGASFWDFLKEQKIPFDKNDFPFLTSHPQPQIKQVFDCHEFCELRSRGEALAYLYNGLGKALNYVGPVLDLELEHGFNDHTDRHTLWVSQTGVELLQRAGTSYDGKGQYDALTEVLMTLVGMTHDLGNLLSRKEHSNYSVWLLTKAFGKLPPSKRKIFERVLYTILFHEEPVLVKLKMPLEKGIPLQWGLVLADKMHVGRDRIGGRSFAGKSASKAFEDDVHILLNSLIVRSTWYLGVKSFVWHLDFSVDQLEEKFKSFTKGQDRLWMPKLFQLTFLRRGVTYRESFARQFREVYADRMRMAARSAFLLFPFVENFEVKLVDTDTRGKVGSGELMVWQQKRVDAGVVRKSGTKRGGSEIQSLAKRVKSKPYRMGKQVYKFYHDLF